MAKSDTAKCHQAFESGYNKSALFLLYGGMRKSLFVNKHPLDGISSKHLGITFGKAFYDLNKQELEYKDSSWRVKANFGDTKLFNMKMKLGEKKQGETRNNVQFGTDQSHFGSDGSQSKMSVGGMFTFPIGIILTTTRLKVFNDAAAEVFVDAELGTGIAVAADLRVTQDGAYKGFVGASAALPTSVPVLKSVHVGSIVALPELRPSVGIFFEAPVPAVQKAVIGVELFNAPQMALVGAEVKLDGENSVNAKVGDNGIAQISFLKKMKGMDLRMAVEANLREGQTGRFGVQVTTRK